jgi:hypothetical protein
VLKTLAVQCQGASVLAGAIVNLEVCVPAASVRLAFVATASKEEDIRAPSGLTHCLGEASTPAARVPAIEIGANEVCDCDWIKGAVNAPARSDTK